MRRILLIGILYIFSFTLVSAQDLVIHAARTDLSPTIDGKLDEPFWQDAIPFSTFKMVEPIPGADPTEKTEIKVLYNQTGLYLGIRCFDSDPAKIAANTMVHDGAEERNEDQVSI